MSLKPIIVTLTFLLISITTFGQYTFIQKLGSIATVAFPDTPKTIDVSGVKQYLINHDGITYQAALMHVNKGLKNIFNSASTDSVFNDYVTQFLESTKGTLLYKDKITLNGHEAIQFGFKTKVKDRQLYGYYRVANLNDTLVTCGLIASDLVPKDHQALKTFFNTFKVISVAELEKIDASNTAYRFGEGIGTLMTIGFFVAVGFAIVAFLKKIIYKKQKQQSS
ncbi:hypothetical protein [Mucilaginibacter sp. HD30]